MARHEPSKLFSTVHSIRMHFMGCHSVQVYVSSLTSTVQQLSQQVTDLSTTGTALSANINLAFGDNAAQRDSNTEVQITTMYQVINNGLLLHRKWPIIRDVRASYCLVSS